MCIGNTEKALFRLSNPGDCKGRPLIYWLLKELQSDSEDGMPRKARIDAPGALHHIILQGIERNKIFYTAAGKIANNTMDVPDNPPQSEIESTKV